ncbi:MAG: cytochrome C assembly protein, partial [Caldimonas sp.]
MILSFGPSAQGTPANAIALSVPSLVALVCFAIAALPGDRYPSALRTALLAGWVAQGLAIVIDIAGLGTSIPGARFGFAPALSVTLWLVLAVYALESRFVPLPGARRRIAWIGCAVVLLAWAFPGQLHPTAASKWAPLHWLLGIASYGL